jgi:hypothetical protein
MVAEIKSTVPTTDDTSAKCRVEIVKYTELLSQVLILFQNLFLLYLWVIKGLMMAVVPRILFIWGRPYQVLLLLNVLVNFQIHQFKQILT